MFRLALALGRDVREIELWPSRLISEWMAYSQIDPIPDSNWQTGLIASTMCNLWSKSKTKPEDFIPRIRVTQRQSSETHLALFKGIAAAQKAKAQSKMRS
jgi:hypothetical protein